MTINHIEVVRELLEEFNTKLRSLIAYPNNFQYLLVKQVTDFGYTFTENGSKTIYYRVPHTPNRLKWSCHPTVTEVQLKELCELFQLLNVL